MVYLTVQCTESSQVCDINMHYFIFMLRPLPEVSPHPTTSWHPLNYGLVSCHTLHLNWAMKRVDTSQYLKISWTVKLLVCLKVHCTVKLSVILCMLTPALNTGSNVIILAVQITKAVPGCVPTSSQPNCRGRRTHLHLSGRTSKIDFRAGG